MSHVYQPVLIRSLVDAGGHATIRQLAQASLIQDESQLLYYEKRIKQMPFKVLKKHGVVEREGDLVSLTTGKLTLEQKARIRMLCEQRLQDFVTKRGLSVWDYRLLEADPVPDSVRYEVLKAANGRWPFAASPTRNVRCKWTTSSRDPVAERMTLRTSKPSVTNATVRRVTRTRPTSGARPTANPLLVATSACPVSRGRSLKNASQSWLSRIGFP